MNRIAVFATIVAISLIATPLFAVDVDRDTVRIQAIEAPLIDVSSIDMATLIAESGHGAISVGPPILKTTYSWCAPTDSKNKVADAVEIPTHYFEIPYEVKSGVVIVRGGEGEAIFSAELDGYESFERYGYDECKYWNEKTLKEDFLIEQPNFERQLQREVADSAIRAAEIAMDDALFFNVLEERIPVYRFSGKRHDYSDLNRAADLARRGYAKRNEGLNELRQALQLWRAAVASADMNDSSARINRKVTVKLYESIGVASLVIGDSASAVLYLEKANRYSSMTTSRTNGSGSQDLLERARERNRRRRGISNLPDNNEDLSNMIQAVEQFRGQIPIHLVPVHETAALMTEHAARSIGEAISETVHDENVRQQEIAAGRENPYERQVGRTASQGFYLFLMPYGNKFDEFPEEVCDLTHLNQLRMPKHGFTEIPDSIGNLSALKVLDLSGNQIAKLPDSIGKLTDLKTLKLKDNPLAPGELERIKKLLPNCKIKG
jgi:hypothetical protein